MSRRTDLIQELATATAHMEQLAKADDWAMAEQIQRRRATLIEEIAAMSESDPPTDEDIAALKAIRKQEGTIAARAGARQQSLGAALDRLRTGARPTRNSRLERAYGAPARKR